MLHEEQLIAMIDIRVDTQKPLNLGTLSVYDGVKIKAISTVPEFIWTKRGYGSKGLELLLFLISSQLLYDQFGLTITMQNPSPKIKRKIWKPLMVKGLVIIEPTTEDIKTFSLKPSVFAEGKKLSISAETSYNLVEVYAFFFQHMRLKDPPR